MKGVGLSRRGTFLRRSGPLHDPDRFHLHVICTDQDRFGLMLVVPLCSLQPYTRDRACVLGIGDHPFIKRRSFIDFGKAEISEFDTLKEGLRRCEIEALDDCREDIFEQICRGLTESTGIRPGKAAYYLERTAVVSRAA